MLKLNFNIALIKEKSKKEMVKRIALIMFSLGMLIIYYGGIRTGNPVGQLLGLVIIGIGCILVIIS